MDNQEDRQKLEHYLGLFSPTVRRNLEIVSASDNPAAMMLHIDIEGSSPKRFYPKLSQRAADSENVNVPRVTVADTLIGCMIAYSAIYFDFVNDKAAGWEINGFTYRQCLKPTLKMVYDQDATGEHWLVGYDKASSYYTPVRLGTFFIVKLESQRQPRRDGKMISLITNNEFAIEIKDRVQLQPGRFLDKGHYRLTIDVDLEHRLAYDDQEPVKVEKISVGEFNKLRNTYAPDLALEHVAEKPQIAVESMPLYAKW